jgi:hypothetical protein
MDTAVIHESVWVWRPFEKDVLVSGNCERSTRDYTVDDEDIRSSGLEQVNDGLYADTCVPRIVGCV